MRRGRRAGEQIAEFPILAHPADWQHLCEQLAAFCGVITRECKRKRLSIVSSPVYSARDWTEQSIPILVANFYAAPAIDESLATVQGEIKRQLRA